MIITREAWHDLCLRKIKITQRLIDQGEWALAAEIMGYALECALKAAACRTLNTSSYPPIRTNEHGPGQELRSFRVHEFDLLLIYSGLSDIFGSLRSQEWSDFTYQYTGNWPEMRYDRSADEKFDEATVKHLYEVLYDSERSIIKQIEEGERW